MDATGTPLGPAVPETVELTIEGFPHLSSHEWMALERMRDVIGEAAVVSLLRSASPEDQKSAVVSFMHHEIMSSRKQVATPVSSLRTVPLKLDVSPYRGGENEPLSRWFVELDAAIAARQLRDFHFAIGNEATKRPSDQVNREERPSSKRQRTAPELFDISPILKKKGELEFYKERFFSWRRINDRDDPNQHIAAQRDSWRTFVRLENENKMERLLRRGNARAQRRTPADDRANPSSGRRSVAPGDATSSSHSCGPRREHQTPMSDEAPTVDGSTASFLDDESVDLHDQQSTQPPSDALPESLTTGVGLNEKTIERLWKWKSAHRGQIEALQQRCSTLEEYCESLENLVADHESKIDDLTEGSAQCSALESRYEQRFQQVQDELVRLQKNEKSRELAHDRLLRSVGEAGSALEVLRGEYHSRLQALETMKDQSFDVLQLLYAEKNLQSDELFALRNQVEKLHDQLDRLREIS
ncbi:hypothetical protein FI667_g16493, partial [Globisporangium splendens]